MKPARRTSKRYLVWAILVLVGALVCWLVFRPNEAAAPELPAEQTSTAEEKSSLRLIATGDIIGNDSINLNAKTDSGYNYLELMKDMQPYFERADIRFCNQATLAGGEEFGISGYPVFNAPLELTHDMTKLGCNLINTGSNHSYDKGQAVINASVGEWDKQDLLAHGGANRSAGERDKVKYFEIDGVKFAFVSYVTYSNTPVTNGYGVTMYNQALAKRQLNEARAKADIVLASLRWGTEYSQAINSHQDKLAKQLADMGADVILGHGTHVIQPVKKLTASDGRQVIAWFSLGNFLNAQLNLTSLVSGLAVMDIDKTTHRVTDIGFMPIYQHYDWTADQKRREDLLSRHNFQLVPLDRAKELLASSHHNTTVEQQQAALRKLLNTYTTVPLISSSEY